MKTIRSGRATAALLASAALLLVSLDIPAADAAGIIVVDTTADGVNGDTSCSLQEAIYAANLDDNVAPDPSDPTSTVTTGCLPGSGTDVILLPAGAVFDESVALADADNFVGLSATPMITSKLVIEGRGARLRRESPGQLLRAFVVGPTGDLTLHELELRDFAIRGGSGSSGGGGGLGAGGAVYVEGGSLSVGWVTFVGNSATGGNGGSSNDTSAGGGGGLAGSGGADGGFSHNGGGGGGASGAGSAGFIDAGGNHGGSGGGRVTSASGATPGYPCGALGGVDPNFDGSDSGHDAPCNGGGGGGGTSRELPFDVLCGGHGGDGAYGGGGGGGGEVGDGGHGGFGGGGGGNGGDGGFGGGGGSNEACPAFPEPGAAGTFAGDGGQSGGGGGAALGGAIFGHDATIVVENSTFTSNRVSHGLAGNTAHDGADAGGAIFTVGGRLSVNGSTVAANTSTGDGAGIVVYKSTDGGATASLDLRNTIIAGNGDRDECFLLNGPSAHGSGNLILPHAPAGANPGDQRPACPGIVVTADPNLGSLQLNAPGTTRTMALSASSAAINTGDASYALVDDQRGILRTDGAPDIGAFEFSGQPPVTTISLSPGSPDGDNDWYVNPVDVGVDATDSDSAVAQTRCALDPATVPATFNDLPNASCSIGTVSADGSHAVYGASVDTEGNVEIPVVSATFAIDRTAPELDPSLSSTDIFVGQASVTATAHASDATSGVASSSCDPVDTSTPGVHTVACTATDAAGNIGTGSVDYLVAYRILGFFEPAPGSKWLAGSTVPIKVALGDVNGVRITDGEAAVLAAACQVTFAATGAQATAGRCLRYDAGADQFVFTWKLGKKPLGIVTIAVSVAYPGTTATTVRSEQIVIRR